MHINAYKNTVCEVAELVIQQQTCVELSGTLMEFPGCQGTICSCPTRLMSHMWIRPASHQISAVAYLHLITETENILLIHTQLKLTIMLTHTHTESIHIHFPTLISTKKISIDPRVSLVIAYLAVSHLMPSSFVPTNHLTQKPPSLCNID